MSAIDFTNTTPSIGDEETTGGQTWVFNGVGWVLKPYVPPAFSGALVSRSSNQSIADFTNTAISFDTIAYDTEAYYSAGSPTLFTIPRDGKYVFSAGTVWAASTSGQRALRLRKNGSEVPGGFMDERQTTGTTGTAVEQNGVSAALACVAGDTFDVYALQTSGGALNLTTLRAGCWFAVQKVG